LSKRILTPFDDHGCHTGTAKKAILCQTGLSCNLLFLTSGHSDPCTSCGPDDRPGRRCPRGRAMQAWVNQLEVDARLYADVAWSTASDHEAYSCHSSSPV